jgi:hypothetical protein
MIEMSTGEGIQGCSKGSTGTVHPSILENYVRRRHLSKKKQLKIYLYSGF